jgi:hypothetical protein
VGPSDSGLGVAEVYRPVGSLSEVARLVVIVVIVVVP